MMAVDISMVVSVKNKIEKDMIIKYPNKFLRKPTVMVDLPLNTDHESLIKTMIEEMYKNNGVGLAANQIGSSNKIFVIDISNERNNPQVFINPIIKKQDRKSVV